MRITTSVALAAPLFLASMALGQVTQRASEDSSAGDANAESYLPRCSANGRHVVFSSSATNLVTGDLNGVVDVFVKDLLTGSVERVSVDSAGVEANDSSGGSDISADGRLVVFHSTASNLVAGDTNRAVDCFLRDRVTGLTSRISVDAGGNQANAGTSSPRLSADGRWVVFSGSASNLVPGDLNGQDDVFLKDVASGGVELVSVSTSGTQGNGSSQTAFVSDDGTVVCFMSSSSNLDPIDPSAGFDVFKRDRAVGTTVLISVDRFGHALDTPLSTLPLDLSADGSIVVFASRSDQVVPEDHNEKRDVFARTDLGPVERVSVDSDGQEGNGDSGEFGGISADGRYVAFNSGSKLTAESYLYPQAYVRDLQLSMTSLASVANDWQPGDHGTSRDAVLSSDGSAVVFVSSADNLVDGDDNDTWDAFLRTRSLDDAAWSNYGAGLAGTLGVPGLASSSAPELNRTIQIDLGNSAGAPTVAALFLGLSQAQLPTAWGADLLVLPLWTLSFGLPPAGLSLPARIPPIEQLCGVAVFLQALMVDAGAVKGVAFTPGLELAIGR